MSSISSCRTRSVDKAQRTYRAIRLSSRHAAVFDAALPGSVLFACAGLGWTVVTAGGRRASPSLPSTTALSDPARTVCVLMSAWMLVYLVFLCCVSYAPSRYNVLFYPAMAALSAFALMEAPRVAAEIVERKLLLAIFGSLLICLAGQALRSRIALIDVSGMNALFWALACAFLIGSQLQRAKRIGVRHRYAEGSQPPEIWFTGLAIWAIVNCYWTGDWLLHITYRQKAADHWLASHVPPQSTLIGAAAPGSACRTG